GESPNKTPHPPAHHELRLLRPDGGVGNGRSRTAPARWPGTPARARYWSACAEYRMRRKCGGGGRRWGQASLAALSSSAHFFAMPASVLSILACISTSFSRPAAMASAFVAWISLRL